MKSAAAFLLFVSSISAGAETRGDVVCSYAPSQSKAVAALSGAAGGSAAALAVVGQAVGLTVVSHSSGAAILTGSGGYLAGTLGAAAITGPVIVAVGVVMAGAAVSVELVCAPKNHPRQTERVKAAAMEFVRRSGERLQIAKASALPQVERATVALKKVQGDVFRHASQKSE